MKKLDTPADQANESTPAPESQEEEAQGAVGDATSTVLPPGDAGEGQNEAERGTEDATGEQVREEGDGQHVDAPYGYKTDGTPKKAPGGRPPKDLAAKLERDRQRARLRSVTPGVGKIPQAATQMKVTPLAVVNYEAMGENVASMWFHGGELIFGEEWAPDTKEGEHTAVAKAFGTYFKAVQMRDLPPGIALCFVLGIYTLKRTTRPTVKSRLQLGFAWLKEKMPFRKRGLRLVTERGEAGG